MDAEKPELLTSTALRKHVAILSQVLNLKDQELDILARFLGHDIRIQMTSKQFKVLSAPEQRRDFTFVHVLPPKPAEICKLKIETEGCDHLITKLVPGEFLKPRNISLGATEFGELIKLSAKSQVIC